MGVTMQNFRFQMTLVLSIVSSFGFDHRSFAAKPQSEQQSVAEVHEPEIGDPAPVFSGIDEMGNPWQSQDHLGNKHIVVYFYPADFTVGCGKQAISFRDGMNQLNEFDVEVIGVSADSINTHRLFKQTWNLNFTLISDDCFVIADEFGVPVRGPGIARARYPDGTPIKDDNGEQLVVERDGTFLRWMYVIGKEGTVIYKNKNVRPAKASEQIRKFLASHNP